MGKYNYLVLVQILIQINNKIIKPSNTGAYEGGGPHLREPPPLRGGDNHIQNTLKSPLTKSVSLKKL